MCGNDETCMQRVTVATRESKGLLLPLVRAARGRGLGRFCSARRPAAASRRSASRRRRTDEPRTDPTRPSTRPGMKHETEVCERALREQNKPPRATIEVNCKHNRRDRESITKIVISSLAPGHRGKGQHSLWRGHAAHRGTSVSWRAHDALFCRVTVCSRRGQHEGRAGCR